MRNAIAVALLLAAVAVYGQNEPVPPISISVQPMGDSGEHVAVRVVFTFDPSMALPTDREVVLQGSILQDGTLIRNFRRSLLPEERSRFTAIQVVPAGEVTIEARLLALGEQAPLMIAKHTVTAKVERSGVLFTATEDDEADAILAEGAVPETAGAVRILAPRRDLAPNLFRVEVEVKAPVRRVEFFVDDRKILTRNAPPYEVELDLGTIPQRVEVRAVGYDARGRYVDADAWIVNERENDLEVKITRTETPDGMSRFRVSVQNPKKRQLGVLRLAADDQVLIEWRRPPYAFDIPTSALAGKDFVTATVTDATGMEASDLIYLDGNRYVEQVDVNLVELPVTVLDASGTPIFGLEKEAFQVLENGKPKAIDTFGFSANLPLSVGLLVDHSGSMAPRIDRAREAAVGFFSQILREGDKAFFGSFAFSAKGITPFVSDLSTLRSEIDSMPKAEGATALYDAIVSGLYRFRSIQGRKALIIVSDGEDTASRVDYDEMLRYVRAARVPIYFIGIGISRLEFSLSSQLKTLAAETGGVTYFVNDVDQLRTAYTQLENELRSQYLLGYYTESTKGDRDYRTVDVKVDRTDAKVRTIRGFVP
ncbi:MAG: VWA domain-containing protein [Thermoanaerobaculia bacterium]